MRRLYQRIQRYAKFKRPSELAFDFTLLLAKLPPVSERKLKTWEAAGLIDAQTAARIRAWEAENGRPLAIWAVIGLGALAIGLGLISVVAANWDAVPGEVRLAIHLAVLAGVLAFMWLRGADLTARQPWIFEALLFVTGVLGLTFMAHVGQVYQTSSPLWQPFAIWLLLFGPLLFAKGQSWLAALTIMVGLQFVVWGHVSVYGSEIEQAGRLRALSVYLGAMAGVPLAFAALGAFMRGRSERGPFWQRIEQLGIVYAVFGASFAAVAAVDRLLTPDRFDVELGASLVVALAAILAAGVVFRARQTESGQSTAAVLGVSALVVVLSAIMPGGTIVAALLFFALWGSIAAASLHAGWRGVFQIAVAILAVRLITLSFELAGDLLGSGVGLIVAGLLVIAVAWGAVRISKRFAPKAGGDQ